MALLDTAAHGRTEKGGEMGMKANKYPISEYEDLEMPYDDMDTDIRNWHSHLVKVRKDTKCVYCGAPINKGDFALSERGFCDGKPFLIHGCIDCVDDLIAYQKSKLTAMCITKDGKHALENMSTLRGGGEVGMKIGCRQQELINWPPLEEVENLRWANNHTQYRSIIYGFCEAQDCCEVCDSRMRMLCKANRLIDRIRLKIIKRHYGIKNGW